MILYVLPLIFIVIEYWLLLNTYIRVRTRPKWDASWEYYNFEYTENRYKYPLWFYLLLLFLNLLPVANIIIFVVFIIIYIASNASYNEGSEGISTTEERIYLKSKCICFFIKLLKKKI